jgi:hypothetical protein
VAGTITTAAADIKAEVVVDGVKIVDGQIMITIREATAQWIVMARGVLVVIITMILVTQITEVVAIMVNIIVNNNIRIEIIIKQKKKIIYFLNKKKTNNLKININKIMII